MKLTTQEIKDRQAHIDAICTAKLELQEALDRYNGILAEADSFIGTVRERLQVEFDDKSEAWQEGEKGTTANEFISEWDQVDFTDIDVELDHAEILEQLPTETE